MHKSLKKFFVISVILGIATTPQAFGSPSKYPKRIVSLSPSATEDLFAIGAGKQVIAVDDNSNFPIGVPTTKLSSFNPSAEAIAKYRPDLVIIQSTATKSTAVVGQLRKLKIKVYLEKTPTDLAGLFKEINDLAILTGNMNKAKSVISKISNARSLAKAKVVNKGTTFYHELDSSLYSATSSTFIGKVYSDFGLVNIADAAAKADDGGYPQLQNEYLISANPQYIFLADSQYGENAEKLSQRPGWQSISAVKNQKIIALPADIASRWGPRITDFYLIISNALS